MSTKQPVIFPSAVKAVEAFESVIQTYIAVGLPMPESTLKKQWLAVQTIYATGMRKRQTDAASYQLVLDRIGGHLSKLDIAVREAKPVDPLLAGLQAMTVTAMNAVTTEGEE